MLQEILDWLEVWALFIPLLIVTRKRTMPGYIKPVKIYLWLALIINLLADISWKFKAHYSFPVWFQTNTYFYNLHSIVRFFLFSSFFIKLNQPFLSRVKKIIPVLFFIFIIINFVFFEPFVNYWYENGVLKAELSNNLLSIEAVLLLFYCLQYFLGLLKEDEADFTQLPSFWITTGLGIFVVASFPIYLFYNAAYWRNQYFVVNIWIVQKIAFLIFCVFMTIGFTRVTSAESFTGDSIRYSN